MCRGSIRGGLGSSKQASRFCMHEVDAVASFATIYLFMNASDIQTHSLLI